MKKSTVIATCLVNSSMVNDIESAENAVMSIFQNEFPEHNFNIWNTEIHEQSSSHIINGVGRASEINVKKIIQDLWG